MDCWDGTSPTTSVPRTRQLGIFQFSLRTLLVVMALVAAFFGGRTSMMPLLEAERAQRRTVENLIKTRTIEKEQLEAKLRMLRPTMQIRFQPFQPPPTFDAIGSEGVEKAERANLRQHQQRYQRLNVVPEPLPRGGPAGELPMRVR